MSQVQLDRMERKIDNILRYMPYLPLILKAEINEEKTMSELTDAVANLNAKVEADTAVDSSAVTLMTGLTAIINQLKDQVALAADVPAAVAAVNAAAAALEANQASLASAVTANTPVA